jgi:hypothetical protein
MAKLLYSMKRAPSIHWIEGWMELQSQYGHCREEKNPLPLA